MSVGGWSYDKLAFLAYYVRGFAKLCTKKAHGWYFIDAFAGLGAAEAPDLGVIKGSALIGLTQAFPPTRALLIEQNPEACEILRSRCAKTAPPHDVLLGDANEILSQELRRLPDRRLPAFCVLDPLAWTFHGRWLSSWQSAGSALSAMNC